MAEILIVDDHESVREGLAAYLRHDGHEVSTRADGSDFRGLASRFDLFILDIGLPGRDGLALARELKSQTKAPFLFLTARDTEADRIAGWEEGACDYIVKPFFPRELVLRVRALLGRPKPLTATPGQFGLDGHTLVLEASSHRLTVDGDEVALTPGEWSFLEALGSRPGTVLSRKELMSFALEYYVDTGERTVDTHIKNLRAKLPGPEWIETVRGFGYRFAGTST